MKLLFTFLLFPLLAAAQPMISCTDMIKPYEDFQNSLGFEEVIEVL